MLLLLFLLLTLLVSNIFFQYFFLVLLKYLKTYGNGNGLNLSIIHFSLIQGSNQRSVNHDLRIEFIYSILSIIYTLRSFCEICESKFSYFQNFCLQGNHKVSAYTSSSKNSLYLTPKSIKMYTIFLNSDSILVQTPNWRLTSLLHTLQLLERLPKSLWITSEKII